MKNTVYRPFHFALTNGGSHAPNLKSAVQEIRKYDPGILAPAKEIRNYDLAISRSYLL